MSALNYAGQRVLVLAPHADDETLGCGGVVQKYLKSGSPVRIVVASFVMINSKRFNKENHQYHIYSGVKRMKELEAAFGILGVSDYDFLYLDQSDDTGYHSKLDKVPRVELVGAIERHIQDFSPTVLFIPSKTKHQDHEYLHLASLTASRPYFWNGSVIVYETDGEFEFTPNLYVSMTEDEAKIKASALSAYETQLGSLRHPVNPQALLIKAKYRGMATYSDYAEAFQILRLRG